MTGEQLELIEVAPGRRRGRRPAMSEARLLEAVRKLARLTGWLMFHCHDSRGSIGPGFPDVVLVHARQGRVLFVELKTEVGSTTPEQETWLRDLAATGCETAIWRPRDLPEIASVLRGRRIEPGEFGISDLPTPATRWHR